MILIAVTFLVDADGSVLDAIKRVGPRLSRVRPILAATASSTGPSMCSGRQRSL